jgi:hypothetical protein
MSYQAIKRLRFGCTRVFNPFLDAPTAHDVAQDAPTEMHHRADNVAAA